MDAGACSRVLCGQLLSGRLGWSQIHHQPDVQGRCKLHGWCTEGHFWLKTLCASAVDVIFGQMMGMLRQVCAQRSPNEVEMIEILFTLSSLQVFSSTHWRSQEMMPSPCTYPPLSVFGHFLLPQKSWRGKALEGRKEGCRARYSQKWLIGVKRSALETRFVLAEGTLETWRSEWPAQSRCDLAIRPKGQISDTLADPHKRDTSDWQCHQN